MKRNKPFFAARSMIDIVWREVVKNNTEDWESAWDQEQRKIRNDLKKNLPEIMSDDKIFLISKYAKDSVLLEEEDEGESRIVRINFTGFGQMKEAILVSLHNTTTALID